MSFTIRELESLADYDACIALQDETWGRGFSERVPVAILRVAQKIGGVSAGAFDDEGQMAGFVFGMTGLRDGALVHWSDMLAVRPDARGTGLAERLKQYQRERVLSLGARLMYWTADPLVARNAHFNINHLGAMPSEYIVNMYGDNTGSILHGAMPTDRFVYRWQLDQPTPAVRSGQADAGDAALPAAIAVGPDGAPAFISPGAGEDFCVRLPHDLTAMQASDPALALAWRVAVRDALASGLSRGYAVARFVRGTGDTLPYYVLTAAR